MIITEEENNMYKKIKLYVRIIIVAMLSVLLFIVTLFTKKDYD